MPVSFIPRNQPHAGLVHVVFIDYERFNDTKLLEFLESDEATGEIALSQYVNDLGRVGRRISFEDADTAFRCKIRFG